MAKPVAIPVVLATGLLVLGLLAFFGLRADPNPAPPEELPGGWATGIDGAWALARDSLPTTRVSQPIESIGYAGGTEAATGESGVTTYDSARSAPGWNLYSSGHGPEAFLIDELGEVRHRWGRSWRDVPGAPPLDHRGQDTFRRVELLPGGHLLVVFGGRGLVKLNQHSEVVWSYTERTHHDLELLPNGEIWTLIRSERWMPQLHPSLPVFDDYAVRLSPDGQELARVSILDALLRTQWAQALPLGRDGDILHTNSIRVLDDRHQAANPAFRPGNLLLCVRELDFVCVLDPRSGQLVYGTHGPWRAPHDPTVTKSGLLLFDNLGNQGHSRALEFNLGTGQIQWSYVGQPASAFSTLFCGTARRLAGGNTMLTESMRGRAIEITPQGEVVWEFHNPKRAGRKGELVAAIFEMRRLPVNCDLSWL